jgi:hypothetical protein
MSGMDQAYIRSQLSYDPETGKFVWIAKRRGVQTGAEAGRINSHGYHEIGLMGRLWGAHRLAFLWMDGALPEGYVDHISGNRSDNRWSNLRECTQSQNMANVGLQADNTSGVSGVTWDKSRNMWRAQIRLNGKKKNLGRFADITEAAAVVKAAAVEQWGEFSR